MLPSLLTLTSIILTAVLSVITYRLFFHPLAGIPGPRWAAISNVWYALQVRNGRMLIVGKTLHKRYGPVIRVGPNELWFDSKEAFAQIYNIFIHSERNVDATRGFEKSDFYLATALQKPKLNRRLKVIKPDVLDLLSERHLKRYKLQRRLIGPIYQTSNLLQHEAAVDSVLLKALDELRALNGAEINLTQWMHIITVECLSAICLSWSPGYIAARSDGHSGTHAYQGWRRKSIFGLFPHLTLLASYSRQFGRLFSNLWVVTYKTPPNFKPFFVPVYTKSMKRISAALRKKPLKDDRVDLTRDLIELHKERAEEFPLGYLKRMIVTNFGAGHETTTSALTSIMAVIGTRNDIQEKVGAELKGIDEGTTRTVSYAQALDLTYTQAVIKEAQRLHPVLGMSPSRTVPTSGTTLHGRFLPAGTLVGCNPNSLHRSADIFGPDAEDCRPERWLDGSADVKEMDRYNLTWGGGARTCPGRNLAYLIVYKVVATLCREFEIEAVIPPDEEQRLYFMAMLTGVKARFVPKVRRDRVSVLA